MNKSINPFARTSTARDVIPPPKAEPAFLSNARCRVIRAKYAELERLEMIAKYRAQVAEADAELRETKMAWLAEKIGAMGAQRTVQLLVRQGYRKHNAEELVDVCGALLGKRSFALSNLKRLEAKR